MNKQVAVITGATSGLGMAYARLLAQKGFNLLITGRRKERLWQVKQELEGSYNCWVKVVRADFNNEREFRMLLEAIGDLESVDLLVNNAGYGCRDGFFENDYHVQQKMLQVHVTSAAQIVHQVVPKMIDQGGGAIINVASLCAFFPGPINYFYSSSKAFLVSFSESLHVDLVQSNIKVQALCPGFIATEFHSRIGKEVMSGKIQGKLFWMKPEEVAKKSLRALMSSQVIYIPGYVNALVYHFLKLLPKSVVYRITMHNMKHFKDVAYASL